jgi:hypothetical protein
MIEVHRYATADREGWNEFNRRASNGHFLFDRSFMEYHADRFADHSLVFTDAGAVVGLLPASVAGPIVTSHGGLSFGGLVVDEAGSVEVMAMLDLAVDHWRKAGAATLIYKAIPAFYHHRPAEHDRYWLWRRDAALVRRDVSSTLYLAARGPLSSRRRRGAKKADKAGVSCRSSDDLAAYWALLQEVLADRHGQKPVHSIEEITALAAAFPANIKLFVAAGDNGPLAGVLVFIQRHVWHAQYIAASEAGRQCGALDALFPYLFDAAQAAGATVFDFGISTESAGRVLNEGLVGQKEEFGAGATVYDHYRLDF